MLRNYLTPSGLASLQREKAERLKQQAAVVVSEDMPDVLDWIQSEFYIPETNAPIQLVPYQQAVLKEALRKDTAGNFVYSLVLWSDIKKSAKSTIAAAVALYLAWHTPWETVRIVANDLKQADSRTFFYIKRAIELNPSLKAQCEIKNYHIRLPNHTTIDAIPVDPKGEAGGGDLITCFTELWAAKHKAALDLWSETTLSPLKFGRSLRWAESYAGFVGESPILEQLYENNVKLGAVIDVGIPGLELYQNGRTLALWNTVPRCDWQTDEYYKQEATALPPGEFNRMHRNQWGESQQTFIPIELWDSCKGDVPPLAQYETLIIALDAAISGDCFGMVAVSRRGDTVYPRYVRKWTPPPKGQIDFREPEAELRRLVSHHPVTQITYDPYQLHDFMTRLKGEGLAWIEEFTQTTERLIADKQLYDTILQRRITHRGEPDLREHLQNANSKADGERLRIVKRAEALKIDLAVCLSMAVHRAYELNIG